MNKDKNTLILVKSYLKCHKYLNATLRDCLDGFWNISVHVNEYCTIKEAKTYKKEFESILKQLGVKYDSYAEDNDIDSWCYDIKDLYP